MAADNLSSPPAATPHTPSTPPSPPPPAHLAFGSPHDASPLEPTFSKHALGDAPPAHDPEHGASGSRASPDDALRFRSHQLTDPLVRPMLHALFKGVIPMLLVLCIPLIWGLFPIYWGSLYQLTPRRLPAWVVNGDPNGVVGQTLERGILATDNPSNPMRLHWYSKPAAAYPTPAIEEHVLREFDAWIIVHIAPNATAALEEARATGNSSWAPESVVTLYHASSRNFNAAATYITIPTQSIVERILGSLNPALTSTWLDSTASSGNSTALLAAARAAPKTIAQPVWYTTVDLRPFDQSVTVATTFVGLIYSAILTFNLSMALYMMRQRLQVYLTRRAVIQLRFGIPIIGYLPIALMFSMINLPFRVPFYRLGPNNAAGFFAFFACTYVGFLVLGFWLESLLSIMTPQFITFGLVFVICTGVAGANYPVEMLNSFYKWEYAMPFYNMKAIYTTIIFDVGKRVHILKHIGILWGTLALLFSAFPLWILHEQRRAVQAAGGPVGKRWPF